MHNDSLIHDCLLREFNQDEVGRMAPVFVILGFIVLLGCLGNAMSLFIYSRNFKDSNSRSFLILLSAVELFSSTVSVPMEIYNLYVHFNFTDDKLCKSFVYTEICQVSVSCSLLMLIATDRWRKVCHPFGWQMSVRVSKVLCVSIIPMGCLVASPSVAIYGSHYFDMNFSDADFPDCFESNFSPQMSNTSNTSITSTSTVLRTYKCSITNEASEGVLPILYAGFFWFLFFTWMVLLSLMYGKIIRTIKVQDNKLDQNARLSENRTRKIAPKYRPRESIDLDCETDLAPSTYGFVKTSISDVTHDTSCNLNKVSPANSVMNAKIASPSPKRRTNIECDIEELVDIEQNIPRITVIKVEEMPGQFNKEGNPKRSPSKTLDDKFLSPIIKRSSQSITYSPKRVTIKDHGRERYVNDSREITNNIGMSSLKHSGPKNENVGNGLQRVLNKQSDLSSQLSNNTLPPIEENETLRVISDSRSNLDASDRSTKRQIGDLSVNSAGDNKDISKNIEKANIMCDQEIENIKKLQDMDTKSNAAVSSEPESIALSRSNGGDIIEEDLTRSPDISPEHVRVSPHSTRQLKRQSTRRQGRSRNVTVIMLAVTISTIVCFLPYLVLSLLRSLITDFEANLSAPNRVAYNLFLRSIYFKSVLNPLIYGLFDSRFRQVLKNLLKEIHCRK